jgi:CelD/BcsL family acetyltransferase involved in cellulose biosynthesis
MAAPSTMTVSFEDAASASGALHTIDPLTDTRWDDLVRSHPRACAFHQRGWLQALASTYGYKPLVLTPAAAGQRLNSGMVFCEVRSWITGNRLVSLPFSDHCEPLLNDERDLGEFADWMRAACDRGRWKYAELRPLSPVAPPNHAFGESDSFWFHTLDLTPSIEQIFRSLHKNSIQRRIRKAEREGLSYETGRSEEMLDDFLRLLMITRRRHRLPPQPRSWFRNLIAGMGEGLTIRLARKDGIAIATLLTLRHRNHVIYKYGCSDERFHHLAGMPFLFWKLIEESKATGAEQIDFGRTDMDNHGLTTFKDRFGTSRRKLSYFRYPILVRQKSENLSAVQSRVQSVVQRVFSALPDAVISGAGRLLYRHLG